MAAASTDSKASAASGDPLNAAVRAAMVQSAALVLVNAAQHLQRTTLLVETATARAMARVDGENVGESDHGLAVARAALVEAVRLFEVAQTRAMALSAAMDGGETPSS